MYRQGILIKNNKTVIRHPPWFSLFPLLTITLKGRPCDTIEVVELESLAVLNTPTEHIFQDAFKNGRIAGNCAYAQNGTTSTTSASRPKVNF
jgi:hypothetical protein